MALDGIARRAPLLIGGQRVAAASGRYFQTLNPATEALICEVAEADAADVDAAVRSARRRPPTSRYRSGSAPRASASVPAAAAAPSAAPR